MTSLIKKAQLLFAVMAILLVVKVYASDVSFAPFGPVPLLNGLLGEAEWIPPAVLESGWDHGSVYIKKDSQFVYLCFAPKDTLHSGLDLYLDNMAGEIFMLHVSAAHGQRFMLDSIWQETVWGPAKLWTSNIIQLIVRDDKRVILAPEAFEFQIDRQLLPATSFKYMLHFKRPEKWIPKKADTLSSENWPLLGLDRSVGE